MKEIPHRDLKELEELLLLGEDHPRRIEAMRSPRLRNLLREHEQFVSGAPAPDRDVADAERRLAEMRVFAPTPRAPARRSRTWVRAALAAAAVVVVAVGIHELTGPNGTDTPRLRSGASVEALAVEASRDPDGALRLRWEPQPQAQAYRLVLVGSDLRQRASLDLPETGEASVDLSPYETPEGLAFRLIVLGRGGEIGRTALRPVPTR